MDLFALITPLSMALEPVLAQIDRLLDADVLCQRVKADLLCRAPHTATRGRPSTVVEVILRMLVVKRLYGWSDEETERLVADRLVRRQFCRVYVAPVPDDTMLLRWAKLIEPATLAALTERVVALAQALRVTRGHKRRVDSPVVEVNMHHSTDSDLLGDGVRVLSRLLRRAKAGMGPATGMGRQALHSRQRRVRRLVRQQHRLAHRKGATATAERQQASGRLLTVARHTQAHAVRVWTVWRGQAGMDV